MNTNAERYTTTQKGCNKEQPTMKFFIISYKCKAFINKDCCDGETNHNVVFLSTSSLPHYSSVSLNGGSCFRVINTSAKCQKRLKALLQDNKVPLLRRRSDSRKPKKLFCSLTLFHTVKLLMTELYCA